DVLRRTTIVTSRRSPYSDGLAGHRGTGDTLPSLRRIGGACPCQCRRGAVPSWGHAAGGTAADTSGIALAGYALDEDLHDAAADLVLALDGLGEVDHDHTWLAVGHRLHRLLPDLGLATTATDGAAEGAV